MTRPFERRYLITALLWLPAMLLAAVIGNELGWGRGIGWDLKQKLMAQAQLPKQIRNASTTTNTISPLQAEFSLPSLDQAYTEVAERPLFVPTRRLSPPLPPEAQSTMHKGQYTLTGVILAKGKNIALLREVANGKMVRAEQGSELNGMQVERLEAEKIILKQGGEREEVLLKIPPLSKTPPPTTQVGGPNFPGLPGLPPPPPLPVAPALPVRPGP